MDILDFNNLIKRSIEYLEKQQELCETEFHLDSFHRVDYEQETGIMTFSEVGVVPRVVAEFQVAGTLSGKSGTWMWSWDNPYLLENTYERVWDVKKFGEGSAFQKLTEPRWSATEKDAWEMTAITAFLLGAKGAQVIPSDEISAFVVLMNIKKVGVG